MSDDPMDLDLAKRHLQVANAYVARAFPDGIRTVDESGGATVYRLVRFDLPRLIAEVEQLRVANGQLDMAVKARNAGLRDVGELAEFRRLRVEEMEGLLRAVLGLFEGVKTLGDLWSLEGKVRGVLGAEPGRPAQPGTDIPAGAVLGPGEGNHDRT